MTPKEALQSLELKFTSGNSIPVERTVITREEYEALLSILEEDAHDKIRTV